MGGGPRTFQGGLSKWQHRRMQEKLARQKERGLLRDEKLLYLARLRSEIRASNVPGTTSSRSHVQALADRFLRPGAVDLWNEDDGPLGRARPPLPHPQSARILRSGAQSEEEPRAWRGTGNEPLLSTNNLKRGLNQRREYGTAAPSPCWWHWDSGSRTP